MRQRIDVKIQVGRGWHVAGKLAISLQGTRACMGVSLLVLRAEERRRQRQATSTLPVRSTFQVNDSFPSHCKPLSLVDSDGP